MKILIADDHALIRRGLRDILVEELGSITIAEVATAEEVLARVRRENWDVVLLDINMPGRSGLDVLPELKAARPALAVLILSAYPQAEFAIRAVKAGAAGYLAKDGAPEQLVAAVRKVLAGGRYITAELGEALAAELNAGATRPTHDQLSPREFQILRLLATARTVKEIAAELSLSVNTVSTHRMRLLKKLGLAGNVELTRYALQHGLVE